MRYENALKSFPRGEALPLTSSDQELDKFRDLLEESASSTQAQTEIRAQREGELNALKKTLEDERIEHESAISSMRQKHAVAIQDISEQLDSMKRVWYIPMTFVYCS